MSIPFPRSPVSPGKQKWGKRISPNVYNGLPFPPSFVSPGLGETVFINKNNGLRGVSPFPPPPYTTYMPPHRFAGGCIRYGRALTETKSEGQKQTTPPVKFQLENGSGGV